MLRKRYIFVLFKEKLNRIDIQRFCCLARSSFTTSNSDTCTTGNYVHNKRGRAFCVIGGVVTRGYAKRITSTLFRDNPDPICACSLF